MDSTIRLQAELAEWVEAFFTSDVKLLTIVSDPGKGKSDLIAKRADEHGAWYTKAARLTTFQLYLKLYVHRNQVITLDDIEEVLTNKDTRRILMNLCEAGDGPREVAWYGTTSMLHVPKKRKTVKVPQRFNTDSRVLLVSNDFAILSKNLGPLLSRAVVLFFDPTNEETHRYVGEWFKGDERQREIYEWVGANLPADVDNDCRFYVNSLDLARAGRDWRGVLLETWDKAHQHASPEAVCREIQGRSDLDEKGKAAEYEARTGRSRASWFRDKKKWPAAESQSLKVSSLTPGEAGPEPMQAAAKVSVPEPPPAEVETIRLRLAEQIRSRYRDEEPCREHAEEWAELVDLEFKEMGIEAGPVDPQEYFTLRTSRRRPA
jgi:hypothetical protein